MGRVVQRKLTVADNLSAAERSRCMSRVRSRHMKPERMVRSIVHRMCYRFRLHRRDLPGTPDLVRPRRRYLDRALVVPALGLEDAAFFPRTA